MSLGEIIGDLSAGVKTVADAYVGIQTQRYTLGLADKQQTIEELKATTGLLQQQNEAQRLATQQAQAGSVSFSIEKYKGWIILAGVAFFGYKLLK